MRHDGLAVFIRPPETLCAPASALGRLFRPTLPGTPFFGQVPDVVTFSAAINACARVGDWETALGILASLRHDHGVTRPPPPQHPPNMVS